MLIYFSKLRLESEKKIMAGLAPPGCSALDLCPSAAPIPATASHQTPPTLTSNPAPANRVRPPATDPAPLTTSDHPRLDPHLGCTPYVKPTTLLPSPPQHPRQAPVLRRALPQSRPFPRLTSHFLCNIRPTVATCAIYYLKHTCIVITTSR
jgi:hypothetical protein